jgi:hypothetical protein
MTHHHIDSIVGRHFNSHPSIFRQQSREVDMFLPRAAAMTLCRELLHYSLKRIMRCYGKRSHGTVLNAIYAVNNALLTNRDFREKYNNARDEAIVSKRKTKSRYNLHYGVRQKQYRIDSRERTISVPVAQASMAQQDQQLNRLMNEYNYIIQLSIF